MPAPTRRTQADRTAATKRAVLDATIELLVERGYAGMSTRLAAEHAGVSLGTLQHHFRTKAELTVAAIDALVDRLAAEFVAASPAAGTELERVAAVLDRLWVVFRSPSFAAGVELLVASRTDPGLQEAMAEHGRHFEQLIADSAQVLLPELSARPGAAGLLQTSIAALRGVALLALNPRNDESATWATVRDHLLATAARTLNEDPTP